MTQTAKATLKETGLVYDIFPMPSRSSSRVYAVWTINGNPVHCTCKDRRFRPYRLCQHMKDWQAQERERFNAMYDPCMVA